MKKIVLLFILTLINCSLLIAQVRMAALDPPSSDFRTATNPIKSMRREAGAAILNSSNARVKSNLVCAAVIANPPTTTLCAMSPIVLSATGSTYYQWQKDDVDIPGANESSYSVTTPGIYKTYAVESVWTAQTTGITTILNSVFFVDKLKGWAAGDGGVILATTNGGTTWTPQNSTITTDLNGIAFINATTGIAVGDGGKIVRTTNGGSTWASVTSATTSNLYRVSFGDANIAMAAGGGNGPRIVKTTDAGLTWAFTYNTNGGNGTAVYPIDMIDANNAIAVYLGGAAFNSILKTSDSGVNWIKTSLHNGPFEDSHISDIEMQNTSLGFMVGSIGGLGKTTNGGTSWANLSGNLPPNANTYDLEGITFPSSNLGWIVGGNASGSNNIGAIFSTKDGANTWVTETPANAKKLRDLFFVDNENGWAVGENGEIYKHSFNKVCASNTIEITAGSANTPMTVSGATTICKGSSATLTASGCTGTVNWSNGQNSTNSITVSPTVTTTYVATCSTPDVCQAVGTITVINPPVPAITGLFGNTTSNNLSICPGDSIRLSCTNCSYIQGSTLNWSTGATTDTTNFISPYFKPSSTGTYYATRTVGICTSAQSNLVSVTVKSSFNVTGSTSICQGSSATLTATGCPGTVTWSNSGGTGSSVSVSPSVTTTYIASCSSPDICPGNTSATVTVYSASIATPATTKLCVSNPILLTASGSQFYQWQKNDVDIQGANENTYSVTEPGTYKTYAVQSLWTAQNSGISTKLNSIFFVDKLKGWAAGDGGVILVTTNGGTTWTPQTSGVTADLRGIAFVNATTGVAVGGTGNIVRTTNGGTTWTLANSGTNSELYRISFADANTAMVGGTNTGTEGSRIIKSSDGGLNWAIVYMGAPRSSIVPAIDMISASNVIALHTGGQATGNSLLTSTDGGTNWTRSATPLQSFNSGSFFDIEMQNASVGYIVGETGMVGKTTNGGTSFADISGNLPPNSNSYQLRGITFPSTNLGWIVGGTSVSPTVGVIFSTANAGSAWQTETAANSKRFMDLFFVDNENGWAVGENGQIYKHSFNKFCVSNSIEITDGPGNNPMTVSGSTSICIGGSATLTASGCSGTVNWSNGQNSTNSITVSPTVTTTYVATCSTPDVCQAAGTITVINPPVPAITELLAHSSGTNVSICPGDSLRLSCTNCSYIQGATLNWSTGATTDTTNFTSPYFKPSSTGTYYATRSIGSCTSAQSNLVTVTVKPIFNVTGSTSICKGSSATLTATGCPGTVTWTNGAGTGSSVSVSPTVTTTYYASCDNINICEANYTAVVTVYSAVIATPTSTNLCVTNPIVLTATGSAFYQWQKDNVDIQGATGSTYSVTEPGTYKTYAAQSLWTAQNSGVSTKLNSVFFVDKLKGWAVGDGGVILATADGGTTWAPQSSGVSADLNGVAFINATTGIAVGNSGAVVRTTNGGSTWSAILPKPTTANLYRIAFGDASTAMVGGIGDGPRILKTTDAGLTWSFAYLDNIRGTGIYAIDMLNATNAIAIKNGGAVSYTSILKTADGGTNWTAIPFHSPSGPPNPFENATIFDIEMQNATLGFMSGTAALGKTTDGGNTWTSIIGNLPITPNNYELRGITFPSTNQGWIVGGNVTSPNSTGAIFSTGDGGNTWQSDEVTNTKLFMDVFFVDNENGWAVGENGQIYKHSFNKFCPSNAVVISATPTNTNPLTLSGTATSGSQATANTITSTQTINSGINVRYTSGKSISLEPNFKADNGSVFKAEIGGACN